MFLWVFPNAGDFGKNMNGANTEDAAICGINREGNDERLDLPEAINLKELGENCNIGFLVRWGLALRGKASSISG
jgi:hypothetical protein